LASVTAHRFPNGEGTYLAKLPDGTHCIIPVAFEVLVSGEQLIDVLLAKFSRFSAEINQIEFTFLAAPGEPLPSELPCDASVIELDGWEL